MTASQHPPRIVSTFFCRDAVYEIDFHRGSLGDLRHTSRTERDIWRSVYINSACSLSKSSAEVPPRFGRSGSYSLHSLHTSRSDVSSPAKVSTCTVRAERCRQRVVQCTTGGFVCRAFLSALCGRSLSRDNPYPLTLSHGTGEKTLGFFRTYSSIVPRSRRICFRPANTPPVADSRYS